MSKYRVYSHKDSPSEIIEAEWVTVFPECGSIVFFNDHYFSEQPTKIVAIYPRTAVVVKMKESHNAMP